MRVALCALLLAYLPGALIFRLPIAARDRRARLSVDERVFWHVILSLAWSLSATMALAAVGEYSFDRLLTVTGALCAGLVIAGRSGLGYHGDASRPSWTLVLPLLLVAVGIWRFFPSSEYVIGGRDPGVYINEGVQIAQRGSLAIHDADMAGVPDFARALFFPDNADPNYESNRFMGFFAMNVANGDVMGQFPHLYPASMAIGYGLYGLSGARMAVGVWAVLGVLAVFFGGSRLFGRRVAWTAAGLLSLHVLQVWFARYPNSEMPMQALLFAALLAFARAHQDDDAFFGPVAAGLMALTILLRLDGLIVVAAIVACAAMVWIIDRRRPHTWFVVVLTLGTVVGVAYLFGPMRGYTGTPILFMSGFSASRLAMFAGAGVLAAAGIVAVRRWRKASVAIPIALTAVVVTMAIYGYFFRDADRAARLAVHDALAFRIMVDFYLLPAGMVAAIIGLAVTIRRQFWRDPGFFVALTTFALLFFYKIRVVPEHFWMWRRFVPIVLPGVILLAVAAALGTPREPNAPRRGLTAWVTGRARVMVGIAFLAWLGQQYASAAAPVTRHVEYAGVSPHLESIAAKVGDRDLLLVESRDAEGELHVFGLPLAYIYARHTLVLAGVQPDKAILEAFITDALRRYDRVLFLGGFGTNLLSRRIQATPLADGRFQVAEYAHTPLTVYPESVRRKDFDYSLYQITLGERAAGDFVLDVGDRDDLNVLRFHAKETTEGRTVRWTGRQSFVAIPGLEGHERELRLTLHDGGRPPRLPRPTLELFLNDVRIGEIAVASGFQTYTVALPAELVAAAGRADEPARLRLLVSTTWTPRAVLGGDDGRDLGVMVDRVEVH